MCEIPESAINWYALKSWLWNRLCWRKKPHDSLSARLVYIFSSEKDQDYDFLHFVSFLECVLPFGLGWWRISKCCRTFPWNKNTKTNNDRFNKTNGMAEKVVSFLNFRCQFINRPIFAALKLLSPNLLKEAYSLDDKTRMADSDTQSFEDDFKDLMRQFPSTFSVMHWKLAVDQILFTQFGSLQDLSSKTGFSK